MTLPALGTPLLVVTNELAGRTEEGPVSAAVEALAEAGPVEQVVCGQESDLDTILDGRGDRTLVVVGGDGSLHTAVRALWRRGEAAICPVGLIPLGTGNDFARGVGIPRDPVEAARLIVSTPARPVDLITDDTGDVVVNAVHVGVGAEAAEAAKPLKPYLKILSFPLGAISAGARVRGWRLRVEVDGEVLARGRQRVLMVGLSNGPTIAGGTAVLAPTATVTDGRGVVTVSFALKPMARLGYALRLLRGTHHGRDDVLFRTGRTMSVAGEAFHINADGQLSGPAHRRTWTVHPGAWRCILPDPPRSA
jgi:diacylglycerol kinase (ATP)